MSQSLRSATRKNGFTLVEVMVSMFLISMLCLGAFVGLQQISRSALSIAVRDEAYHLMQAKAEELLQGSFANFAASADQTITSSIKTTFLPSGKIAAFTLPTDNNNTASRAVYTRRVVAVASTGNTTTLRVEVQWTWMKRSYLISTPLFRMNP